MIDILLFIPIALVAGIVSAGIKHDSIPDILKAGVRFFVVLAIACVVFSIIAYAVCRVIV